jgi:hypothetical protein
MPAPGFQLGCDARLLAGAASGTTANNEAYSTLTAQSREGLQLPSAPQRLRVAGVRADDGLCRSDVHVRPRSEGVVCAAMRSDSGIMLVARVRRGCEAFTCLELCGLAVCGARPLRPAAA